MNFGFRICFSSNFSFFSKSFCFTTHFIHTHKKKYNFLGQNVYWNLQPVTVYKIVTFFEFTLFSSFSLTSFIFSWLSLSFKIATNSSWLIPMSMTAWDTGVSMLLSLLLASIRILLCFFLFLVILSNFLIIAVVKEKIKVKLALAIPTRAPINEMINTPPVVAVKTIKILSMYSKAVTCLLNFLTYNFLWLSLDENNFQFRLFHLVKILFC